MYEDPEGLQESSHHPAGAYLPETKLMDFTCTFLARYFSICSYATAATTNFERPFTPRNSLRSARNFANARHGRFATLDLSTPKNFSVSKNRKLQIFQNARCRSFALIGAKFEG